MIEFLKRLFHLHKIPESSRVTTNLTQDNPLTPAEIAPGTTSDTSLIHASENGLSNNSRSHNERDISRLQGTTPLYSISKTYKVNDLVIESGIVYYCETTITVPEPFNPIKWRAVSYPLSFPAGTPSDTSVIFANEDGGTLNYKNHNEREISRLQGVAQFYSSSKTYKVNDFVTIFDMTWKAKVDIDPPEDFISEKWDALEIDKTLCVNRTGSTIQRGNVVFINGYDALSDYPTIRNAIADNIANTDTLGISITTLSGDGAVGSVISYGLMSNIDTSSFLSGQKVYLSPSVRGALTNVKPAVIPIEIGIVGKVDPVNGWIIINIKQEGQNIHASMRSDTTQSFIENASIPVSLNTNIELSGIVHNELIDNSEILFPNAGIYDVTVEPQFVRSGGGTTNDVMNIFLQQNTNIDQTYEIEEYFFDPPQKDLGLTNADLDFTETGRFCYVCLSTNVVRRYELGNPYQISQIDTGIFDDLDVTAQTTTLKSVKISIDGTKLFTLDEPGILYEYDLPIPYLPSSAVYTGVSLDTGVDFGDGISFRIVEDGTRLFLLSDGIIGNLFTSSYTFGVPYSLATLSNDFIGFSPQLQISDPTSIDLSNDGTKIIYVGKNAGIPYSVQLNMSIPFNLFFTTIGPNQNLDENTDPIGMRFSQNGSSMLVLDVDGNLVIYNLENLFDITNIIFLTHAFNPSPNPTAPISMMFSFNGTELYFLAAEVIYQYTLQEAWEMGTASFVGSKDISAESGSHSSIFINPDGTTFYTMDSAGFIYQYNMTTPFDVNTLVYSLISFDTVSIGSGIPGKITMDNTGLKFYFVKGTDVFALDFGISYDLSMAVYNNENASLVSEDTDPSAITFNPDGTKMFMFGGTNRIIYEYSLSISFDLDTLSYDNKFLDVSSLVIFAAGIQFRNDTGTYLFLLDTVSSLYQFDILTGWKNVEGSNLQVGIAESDLNLVSPLTYSVRLDANASIRVMAQAVGSNAIEMVATPVTGPQPPLDPDGLPATPSVKVLINKIG